MKLISIAVGLFLLLCADAFAQTPFVGPVWRNAVHGTWTITTGGTVQSFTACQGQTSPVGCWSLVDGNGNMLPTVVRCIQNPGSASEDLFVAMDALASTTHGFDLKPGVGMCFPWGGKISVYATTTNHGLNTTEIQY